MKKKNVFPLLFGLVLLSVILNNYKFLLYPYYFVKNLIYFPVNAIVNDNSELNISNTLKDSIIMGLKDDIDNLLKINDMKLSLNNFNYINATVIERNREYWFNSLTINKGKKDGIDLDMAVIDENGLIGRISNISNYSATVKLITTNDVVSKVSAVIMNDQEKVYGIINGYDAQNNLLHLIITDYSVINADSKVETTGMGGVFPSNILIGTVYDVIKDSDGITNIVRVRPASNIEGERYVAILQRKEVLDS